jgi:muconolactone delta-isomerase
MLFFVRAELQNRPDMPREQWLGRVASTWEVIKQLEANGKVITGGAFIGQRGGCVIADVESNDELAEMLNRLPLSGYLEWEVVPMIPADRALDIAKWALQQGAAVGARS